MVRRVIAAPIPDQHVCCCIAGDTPARMLGLLRARIGLDVQLPEKRADPIRDWERLLGL